MRERSFRWLLWALVLFGTSLDQVTKYAVFRWLYNGGQVKDYVVVDGAFKLLAQFTADRDGSSGVLARLRTWSAPVLPKVNHGALFGLGQQYVTLANMIFAVVSVAAALAILYWSTRPSTARDPALCAALGLILAGTLGNLYDRLIFNGVRDFFYFHWIEWPVFNVADCCLVTGASLLLLQAFFAGSVRPPQPAALQAAGVSPATVEQ
jgi:lipoprotein signal peptidase